MQLQFSATATFTVTYTDTVTITATVTITVTATAVPVTSTVSSGVLSERGERSRTRSEIGGEVGAGNGQKKKGLCQRGKRCPRKRKDGGVSDVVATRDSAKK